MCNSCMQELQHAARIAGNSKVMHAKIAHVTTTKIIAYHYFRRPVVDGAKIIACKNFTCNHGLTLRLRLSAMRSIDDNDSTVHFLMSPYISDLRGRPLRRQPSNVPKV